MLRANESLKTMNDIHNWLNLCRKTYDLNRAKSRVDVDLSNLKYVSPIGCTTLLSTLKFLDRYFDLDTIAPKVPDLTEKNVISYIERMNFFKLCPSVVCSSFEEQINMKSLYNRNRKNTENTLNEITLCNDYQDVENFDSSLKQILKNTGISPNRISNISRIVTELGLNSVEHGNHDGKVSCIYCVQTYENANKMEIAISDSGVGIVNTLKYSPEKFTSTHDVVRKAILTNASRHSDQERGKGLPDVQKVAFKLDDVEFYLRTHDSMYEVTNKKVKLINKGTYFCGTYYYLIVHA